MLKKYAKIFGIVMILIGLLGFIPGLTEKEMFFRVFRVNPLLNFIHLATGLIAYFVARLNFNATRLLFQVLGVFYAIISFLGFVHAHKMIFKVVANNIADSWLHLAMAAFCIFMGFFYKK